MPIRGYLSNKSVKRLLVLILVLAIGTPVVLYIIYHHKTDDSQIILEVNKNEADMVLKNFKHTMNRNGIDAWRLNAQAAYVIESQKKMIIEKPKVEFFLENGNNVYLTAQKGIWEIDSTDIQVSGNVVVTQNSYTLKTKQLMYKHDQKQLVTQNSVKITGSRFDLTAGSMNIDLTQNKAFFDNGVTGLFNEAYSF
jgi:LPS export ABC transporter protein LptC